MPQLGGVKASFPGRWWHWGVKDGYIGVSQGPGMLASGPASYKVVGKCGMAWEGVGAGDRVNGKQRGTATSLQMTPSLASHSVGGALGNNADSWARLQALTQHLRKWDRTFMYLTDSLSNS